MPGLRKPLVRTDSSCSTYPQQPAIGVASTRIIGEGAFDSECGGTELASDDSTTLRACANTRIGCTCSCVHLTEVKNLAVAASTTPTFGLSSTR